MKSRLPVMWERLAEFRLTIRLEARFFVPNPLLERIVVLVKRNGFISDQRQAASVREVPAAEPVVRHR
jgi:hypothetical protein